ncbi:MAG: glycosyltransferase family 4 protein [Bryobacteraceae bacterium]|jgi:glycosyltransferase involved in cell wall biosynthesis
MAAIYFAEEFFAAANYCVREASHRMSTVSSDQQGLRSVTNKHSFDVVMLTTAHPATDNRIFYREAKTLAEAGLAVAVIGPHPKPEALEGVWIEALAKESRGSRRLLQGWTVIRLALRLRSRVFLFHDPELFGVALVLRLLGKKVVYDCHENLPAQVLQKGWIPRPLRRPASATAWLMEWLGSRLLSGVAVARDAVLPRFPKNRRIPIRNFPTEQALQSAQGLPIHLRQNVVIYAGGLGRVRGIAELVEAFRHIRPDEAELWLAGIFHDKAFQEEVMKDLPPNIKWLGWLEHPQVLALYPSVKIGINLLYPTPSHKNSQPIKLYEYLAAGIPVIASNFPEFDELLDGCGVQVDPKNPAEIEQAIRDLLRDPVRLSEMSKTGRDRVLASYCWKGEGMRLVDFCNRLRGVQARTTATESSRLPG